MATLNTRLAILVSFILESEGFTAFYYRDGETTKVITDAGPDDIRKAISLAKVGA